MAFKTCRIQSSRRRPPGLASGMSSLIESHSSSVRSLGYNFSFMYPFYLTDEDFSDRLIDNRSVACREVASGLDATLFQFTLPHRPLHHPVSRPPQEPSKMKEYVQQGIEAMNEKIGA